MNTRVRILITTLFALTLGVSGFIVAKPLDSATPSSPQAATTSPRLTSEPHVAHSTVADDNSVTEEQPSQAPEPEPSEQPEPAPNRGFLAQIDNQPFDMIDPLISCVQNPGFTQVTVTEQGESPTKFAAFQLDDKGDILSVSLGDSGANTGFIVESVSRQGNASAETIGNNSYRVAGNAIEMGVPEPDPTGTPFSFDVTCPA